MFLSDTSLAVFMFIFLLAMLAMIAIILIMLFKSTREAYWETVVLVIGRAICGESRDQDLIPDPDSDRMRKIKKSLKKSLRENWEPLVPLIGGLIGCCVLVVGIICIMFINAPFLLEREASAKEGVQEAFAEAGYQVPVDDVIPLPGSCYGEVTTINEPVLSSGGSEIAPAGSLAYYISEDGQTVRVYKDGVEIASVNNEGE